MNQEIKDALETISTVNGYLFTVHVIGKDDADRNLSVRVLEGNALVLNPAGSGKTSVLLQEYVEQVLADAGIEYKIGTQNIEVKGEQEDATTETIDCDGSEARDDDWDGGNADCD